MTRTGRWLVRSAAGLVALGVVGAALVAWWLPSDAELAGPCQFRVRAAHRHRPEGGRVALGAVPGAARWCWKTSPPCRTSRIRVRRLEVNPQLRSLRRARGAGSTACSADGVALPRESARAFRGRADAAPAPTGNWTLAAGAGRAGALHRADLGRPPQHPRWPTTAASDFDPAMAPAHREFSRHGVTPPARLRLERDGEADRWRTLIDIAGGTWNGSSELAIQKDDTLLFTAQLEPRNVDIEQLMQTFDRRAPVAGKVNGPHRGACHRRQRGGTLAQRDHAHALLGAARNAHALRPGQGDPDRRDQPRRSARRWTNSPGRSAPRTPTTACVSAAPA